MIESINFYFPLALIVIGLFFVLTSAMGVVRFRDLYTRLHAASKGSTFGFCFIILGACLLLGGERDQAKAIVAILFQFLSAPIAAHMVARVALKKGVRPIKNPNGEKITDEDIKVLEREAPEAE